MIVKTINEEVNEDKKSIKSEEEENPEQDESEENEGYEWITIFMTLITVFGGFFEIFTVWMIVQHIITIVQNRTTREFIKKIEYGIYNKGCRENCKEALCSNSIKEL